MRSAQSQTASPFSKCNIFRPTLPSPLQRFIESPTHFLATWLYTHQPQISAPLSDSASIKIVCISDTHNKQPRVPNGDILIHAGDLTINGSFAELQDQLDWINTLANKHKIVIAGNHDLLLDQAYYQKHPKLAPAENSQTKLDKLNWGNITYLQDSSTTLVIGTRTLRIYGAPHTPKYGDRSFQYPPDQDNWSGTVPESTDILITHGPVKGHVDAAVPSAGCKHLLREARRVKPRLHVCGHIHQARGIEVADWNAVQWIYDHVNMDERFICVIVLVPMLGAWLWTWIRYACGVKRVGETTFVNAAIEGNEGAEAIIVTI